MNEVRKGSIYYISFWSTYTTKLFIDFPWSLIKKILKSVVMWRCGAWILPVLVGLFCLVSRPFLQNQSVLRMRALIFLVLVFVFVYLRLGSYLYLSSKQTVNAHAPRWLMAFICHSDRATLISTAAVPSHLQARLVASEWMRVNAARWPSSRFGNSLSEWGARRDKDNTVYTERKNYLCFSFTTTAGEDGLMTPTNYICSPLRLASFSF